MCFESHFLLGHSLFCSFTKANSLLPYTGLAPRVWIITLQEPQYTHHTHTLPTLSVSTEPPVTTAVDSYRAGSIMEMKLCCYRTLLLGVVYFYSITGHVVTDTVKSDQVA